MTFGGWVGVWLSAQILAGGPPKLPELPTRGMRQPTPTPSATQDAAPSGPSVRPSPKGTPQTSSPGSRAPDARTRTPGAGAAGAPTPQTRALTTSAARKATSGAGRSPAPVRVRPAALGEGSGAGSADGSGARSMGPLTLASDADYAAWAADDARAAAPLQRVDRGEPPAPRPPGDRPVSAADPAAYGHGVVVRQAQLEPDRSPRFRRPSTPPLRSATVVLGYRNFALKDGLGRKQAWHFGSVEVTPFRRFFRLNLLTEAGVEGGQAARGGDRADFMVVQKLGLGLQYPHWVTPFIEGQGGAGVTRVEMFERNDIGLTWSVGIDVGAQWAVTRWLFLHAAVGWIHPVIRTSSVRVQFDRAAFKLGVGF